MPTIEDVKKVMQKVKCEIEIVQGCEVVIFEKFALGYCYFIVVKEPDGQYDGYMFLHADDGDNGDMECYTYLQKLQRSKDFDQLLYAFLDILLHYHTFMTAYETAHESERDSKKWLLLDNRYLLSGGWEDALTFVKEKLNIM